MGSFFRHLFCVICALLLFVSVTAFVPFNAVTTYISDDANVTVAAEGTGADGLGEVFSLFTGQVKTFLEELRWANVLLPVAMGVAVLVIVLTSVWRHKCAMFMYAGIPVFLSGVAVYGAKLYAAANYGDAAWLESVMGSQLDMLGPDFAQTVKDVVAKYLDALLTKVGVTGLIVLAVGCVLIIAAIIGLIVGGGRKRKRA